MDRRSAWIGALLVMAVATAAYLLFRERSPAPVDLGTSPVEILAPDRSGPPPIPPRPGVRPPSRREHRIDAPSAPERTAEPPPAGDPRSPARVTGRVVSADGAHPIPNARLVLWPGHPDGWWKVPPAKPIALLHADDRGRFTLADLVDAGSRNVTLVVSAAGWGTRFEELHGVFPEVELLIELGPGFVIEGQVTDAHERPLPGARVFVAGPEEEVESLYRRGIPLPAPLLQTRAGGDGRYRLDDVALDESPAICAVDGQGFLGTAWLGDLSDEGRTVTRGIRIERRGALSVHVHDPSGRPVPHGRCRLLCRENGVWVDRTPFAASFAAEGRFEFANLPAGLYTVLVWPEGWCPTHREIEVRAGTEARLEVAGRPGLRLSGRVQDASGKPVAGARLSVHPARPLFSSHAMATHGDSDAGGRFVFEGLPAGATRLEVTSDRFVSLGMTVAAGTEAIVVTLWERPHLEGRVRLEPGHPPPTGVTIWILEKEEGGSSRPSAELAADGTFRVPVESRRLDLGAARSAASEPAGRSARVIVQVSGWPPASPRSVVIRPGKTSDLGEFSRPSGRAVQGRVTGPRGEAVAGARVWLAFERGRVGLETRTDKDGAFRVPYAPRWQGTLVVDAAPDLPFSERFLPAESELPIEVRLARGGRIRGSVTDRDRRPVRGATVLLAGPGPESTARRYLGMGSSVTTDEQGYFLTRALPPAVYRLSVVRNDEFRGPAVTVRDGEIARTEVRIPISIRPRR